jgi:hypothetical protein
MLPWLYFTSLTTSEIFLPLTNICPQTSNGTPGRLKDPAHTDYKTDNSAPASRCRHARGPNPRPLPQTLPFQRGLRHSVPKDILGNFGLFGNVANYNVLNTESSAVRLFTSNKPLAGFQGSRRAGRSRGDVDDPGFGDYSGGIEERHVHDVAYCQR